MELERLYIVCIAFAILGRKSRIARDALKEAGGVIHKNLVLNAVFIGKDHLSIPILASD